MRTSGLPSCRGLDGCTTFDSERTLMKALQDSEVFMDQLQVQVSWSLGMLNTSLQKEKTGFQGAAG